MSYRRNRLALFGALAIALPGSATIAMAAEANATAAATSMSSLVGTWLLSTVDNLMPDGSKVHLYGAAPRGLLIFDADGRYTLQIMRGDRARFASTDRALATPAEYRAAVMGSNTHFGRFSVNEIDHTITFRIEHASFPNWDDTEQKRSFEIKDGRLSYIVPTPTTGAGATGEVVWTRAR